jgi:hypothetical protein
MIKVLALQLVAVLAFALAAGPEVAMAFNAVWAG